MTAELPYVNLNSTTQCSSFSISVSSQYNVINVQMSSIIMWDGFRRQNSYHIPAEDAYAHVSLYSKVCAFSKFYYKSVKVC